jgi:hypothetical protein
MLNPCSCPYLKPAGSLLLLLLLELSGKKGNQQGREYNTHQLLMVIEGGGVVKW